VAAEFFAYVLAASKSDRTRFVHMICGDKFPRALRSPPLIKGEGDVASGGTRRCTNVMWFDLELCLSWAARSGSFAKRPDDTRVSGKKDFIPAA